MPSYTRCHARFWRFIEETGRQNSRMRHARRAERVDLVRLVCFVKGLMSFSAPTYAQVRRAFGGLVRAIYRLEVVGEDRLPVTGPAVVASNHD